MPRPPLSVWSSALLPASFSPRSSPAFHVPNRLLGRHEQAQLEQSAHERGSGLLDCIAEAAAAFRASEPFAYDAPVQKYEITELDSGERVITERVPSVRSVALGYWIGAGSRDEKDERAGVSHFLEHLLFKGSARYSATEIAEIFDGLGRRVKGRTLEEYTTI